MKNVLWFAAGVVVGVAASYRYVTQVHAKIAADEINEAREHYRKMYEEKVQRDVALEEAAERILRETTVEAAGAMVDYSGGGFDKNTPKPKAERPTMDPEAKAPYIISADEFLNTEVGYEQFTLTYFQGDETLVDQADTIVESVEKTVGVANLSKFGHLSEDENIVYIRNERLNWDFEVVRSMGKYSVEVLNKPESDGE